MPAYGHRNTHCKKGHEISGEGKERRCLICRRERQREAWHKNPKIKEAHRLRQKAIRLKKLAERVAAKELKEKIEKQFRRRPHCKKGHLLTEKTRRVRVGPDGTLIWACRCCESERDKLRYRNNPERQAACRARALKYYHEVGKSKRNARTANTL